MKISFAQGDDSEMLTTRELENEIALWMEDGNVVSANAGRAIASWFMAGENLFRDMAHGEEFDADYALFEISHRVRSNDSDPRGQVYLLALMALVTWLYLDEVVTRQEVPLQRVDG